jgi:hypothetical protein
MSKFLRQFGITSSNTAAALFAPAGLAHAAPNGAPTASTEVSEHVVITTFTNNSDLTVTCAGLGAKPIPAGEYVQDYGQTVFTVGRTGSDSPNPPITLVPGQSESMTVVDVPAGTYTLEWACSTEWQAGVEQQTWATPPIAAAPETHRAPRCLSLYWTSHRKLVAVRSAFRIPERGARSRTDSMIARAA